MSRGADSVDHDAECTGYALIVNDFLTSKFLRLSPIRAGCASLGEGEKEEEEETFVGLIARVLSPNGGVLALQEVRSENNNPPEDARGAAAAAGGAGGVGAGGTPRAAEERDKVVRDR